MLNSNARREVLRRVLACIFALACFGGAWAQSDVPSSDLQEASRLLKAGQRDQALERVNKALAANPRDAQARFMKGLIYTEQGKQAEAIEIFTRLTQDYPNLPEPYNNLAVIYAGQGQYDKARASLEQSIRTHPSYATAYENLGDVYAKLASQAYGKALQLDAANTGAQNKLSLVRELVREPAPLVAAAKPKETPKEAPKEAPRETPAAKPAPVPPVAAVQKAPEPAAAPASADVLKSVEAWAHAWSQKDINSYLAHYAPDFKTPGGESRADWEKSRRVRVTGAKSISVAIDSPKVTMKGPQEASVTFRQTYRSDKLNTRSLKTLEMVQADGKWLIKEEKTGKR
jgi:tetratricopeptide (TPR) repeat protein